MNTDEVTMFTAAMKDFNTVKDELEYLRFFYGVADFGPADSDVRYYINKQFMKETGKSLPDGYGEVE